MASLLNFIKNRYAGIQMGRMVISKASLSFLRIVG
jgi:hypothetical protein